MKYEVYINTDWSNFTDMNYYAGPVKSYIIDPENYCNSEINCMQFATPEEAMIIVTEINDALSNCSYAGFFKAEVCEYEPLD